MFQPEIAEESSKTVSSVVIPNMCPCGSGLDHASDLEVIRHDIWELKTQVAALMEIVGMIKDQVEPALEGLAASPIGKMFGM